MKGVLLLTLAVFVMVTQVAIVEGHVAKNPRGYTFKDLGFAPGDSPVVMSGHGDSWPSYYHDNEDDEEDGAEFGSGESDDEDDGIDLDLDIPGGGHVAYQWDGVESPVVIFYDDTTVGTSTAGRRTISDLVTPVVEEENKESPIAIATSKDYGYGFVYESVVTYKWHGVYSGRKRDEDNEVGDEKVARGNVPGAPPLTRN